MEILNVEIHVLIIRSVAMETTKFVSNVDIQVSLQHQTHKVNFQICFLGVQRNL
jgi:hypothetical protein